MIKPELSPSRRFPKIKTTFDCIIIDGDHNWYTVFNELTIIEKRNLLKEGGTIFFHDIAWPYGRRDMYYLCVPVTAVARFPVPKPAIGGTDQLVIMQGVNRRNPLSP